MNYRGALLLDLDGTLVDTAEDFIAVINAICQQEQRPLIDRQRIRNTVSHGARALTALAWSIDEQDDDFEAKRQQLLDRYQAVIGQQAQCFAGFEDLFVLLEQQQIAWGIVTNKPFYLAEALIKQLALKPSEQVLICPEQVSHAKPAPDALLLAAKQLGLSPANCLYAGDHQRDIEAARRAQMRSIACAYGYLQEDDNIHAWQADYIAHTVAELRFFTQQFFALH